LAKQHAKKTFPVKPKKAAQKGIPKKAVKAAPAAAVPEAQKVEAPV
jgi:hypothetical protein